VENEKKLSFGAPIRESSGVYRREFYPLGTGPPVHAKYPGVFDRTGGDLISNGAHFGLCWGILRKRMAWRARIGDVVKCLEKGDFGV